MDNLKVRPLRAVVIVGDDKERRLVQAACRHLGMALLGCTASGLAGMALIETLSPAPDLAIVDLRVTDMDGADLIRSLSMQGADIGLVLCGADCPRLQDTALVLAAALGLRACAAVAWPLSAAVLSAAVAQCLGQRGLPGPATRPFQVPDAIDIRSGLLRDEFELYYQPKVALANGKPRGLEALLRWHHPRHGLLAPASFLPQAEAAGLIDLLTIKVLRMALDDCVALRAAGHLLPVAVNLSPRALSNPDLPGYVADAVRRSGVPPQLVMFEVTEHTEIADLGAALRVLLKLRLRGHPLSLDDYGAGHASILQLSRIPFGEIKLDRRLVHQAWRRPHLEPLLRQAIESARLLGMTSVAEGIETQQDWDFLRKLGCCQAQGYLIARPMPAANLPGWLRQAASAPPAGDKADAAPCDNA